jgi:hypothetical protein
MRIIVLGVCALIVAGCGTTYHSSPDQSRLEGRGETLRSLVDAEWARTKDRIKSGEPVEPGKVYALAEIRMVVVTGQIATSTGAFDGELAREGRQRLEWAQKAYDAYVSGGPMPDPPESRTGQIPGP